MHLQEIQKGFAASMIGASLFFGQAARAEIDYDGIKYLGGGEKVDLNNANIRAYLKIPGLYPTIASKIVTNGPFKTVADIYNIPGLSAGEKEILKKAESRFVTLDVKPEYDIDKINNGYVTHPSKQLLLR
jgi:photosystem II PsbU protein